MSRRTTLASVSALAALALSAGWGGSAANAEAIVYENHNVRAVAPGEPPSSAEHASIDIPTSYAKDRRSWHRWSWVETVGFGHVIHLDLEPRNDTPQGDPRTAGTARGPGPPRLPRAQLPGEQRRLPGARALDVLAHGPGHRRHPQLRQRAPDARGNRVQIVGDRADRSVLDQITDHTAETISFPG
jgi:hypothetical protein